MSGPPSGRGVPGEGRPGTISRAQLQGVRPTVIPTARTVAGTGRVSPTAATLASAVWPGLGQWAAGRTGTAIAHALPVVLALVLLLLALVVAGRELVGALLFQPIVALGTLGGIIALGALRLASMAHALWITSRHSRPGPRGSVAIALTAIVVVIGHLYAASVAVAFYQAGQSIFRPPPADGGAVAPPSLDPAATPGATAAPTPLASGRITVLFVGIDRASDHATGRALTDTIMVASYDPDTARVDMVSIPRDVAMVPLYDRPNAMFGSKINEFAIWAEDHPQRFPDGGMTALVREVEFLLGVDIDAYASIEIAGLQRMLEVVDGVEIVNTELIDDPTYEFVDGRVGFRLEPGQHHLDAVTAMAYVRSRKGTGSDFERARRQQQVLLALRQKLRDPQILGRLPEILAVASETVRTDLPPDQLPLMMDVATRSESADVKSVVLAPTRYASLIPPAEIGGLYALRLDMEEVAALSIRLWGEHSSYSQAP